MDMEHGARTRTPALAVFRCPLALSRSSVVVCPSVYPTARPGRRSPFLHRTRPYRHPLLTKYRVPNVSIADLLTCSTYIHRLHSTATASSKHHIPYDTPSPLGRSGKYSRLPCGTLRLHPQSTRQPRLRTMAHHHHHLHPLQQVHIVRRQRFRQDDSGNVATTIIQVQTEIDSDNTPQRTLIAPAVRPRPSTLPVQDSNTDAPPTSKQAAPTSNPKKPSSSQASDARETEHLSTKPPSTLMVATKGTIPSAASTTAASLTYATATISATASATAAAAEGGMSGGAKAGLALGVLLVFCAILSGILLVYRRKKKQLAAAQAEDEKIDLHRAPPPSTPPVQTEAAAPLAPGLRANRTVSTAPRLSLRPVTQFDPAFTEQRQSRGNLLSVAAAGGVAAQSQNRGQPDQSPTSAWERPGAANAPVTNPFNDPEARSVPPSVNPFGNSAAIDDQHAGIPDSPPNDSPLHSTQPSKDFAKPGLASAAAEVGKRYKSSKPSERPAPLKNANNTNVASSPAWADNLPASPGPAPTGALPIAGGRSQSPAPGPDNVHRVQLDFKASLQDELNLQAGQLVRMLHEYDDGWVSPISLTCYHAPH